MIEHKLVYNLGHSIFSFILQQKPEQPMSVRPPLNLAGRDLNKPPPEKVGFPDLFLVSQNHFACQRSCPVFFQLQSLDALNNLDERSQKSKIDCVIFVPYEFNAKGYISLKLIFFFCSNCNFTVSTFALIEDRSLSTFIQLHL